jgi:hypothetical protein
MHLPIGRNNDTEPKSKNCETKGRKTQQWRRGRHAMLPVFDPLNRPFIDSSTAFPKLSFACYFLSSEKHSQVYK